VTGALWALASGVGFGLFQSLNRRALADIDDAYVSTFLQLVIAAVVLLAASLATADLGLLTDATAWSLIAFALAGVVHFLLGWTFLNMSQQRIGAARTSPLLVTTPVFGLVIGTIVLDQEPGWAALAAIVPMIAGAYLVAGGGREAHGFDALFGLGCALMWAVSPVFTLEGLDGLPSPLLGVTLGMVAAVAAYGVGLARRGTALQLGSIARGGMSFKLAAGVLVALATWWRWIAVDDADIGVVLALNLVSVPIVLFLAPLLVGRHLERVTARVWIGSSLVMAGALALVAAA
jgi:drug/metabolite transporter (DMT)-like permease